MSRILIGQENIDIIETKNLSGKYKNAYEYSGESYCGVILDKILEGKKVISDICLEKNKLPPFIQTHLSRVDGLSGLGELFNKSESSKVESIQIKEQLDFFQKKVAEFFLSNDFIEKEKRFN